MGMHASMAFLNGAGETPRNRSGRKPSGSLVLLNTLLASAPADAPAPDRRKPKDEKQPASKPGGFRNDPDNPKNPNEARERHQKKVRP
jgi:hypothetical protein